MTKKTTENKSIVEVNLEELPLFELRKIATEKSIKWDMHDKKVDLIAMIKTGKTTHEKPEPKRGKVLEPKVPEKVVPKLPDQIKPQLEEYAAKGLTWTINEEAGTVKFTRDIAVTCHLDSSANNILLSAKSAFSMGRPVETSSRKPMAQLI